MLVAVILPAVLQLQLVFTAHLVDGSPQLLEQSLGNSSDVVAGSIMGGDKARRGDYPWHARLVQNFRLKPPLTFCGGSLVHSRWVLTAAHCAYAIPIIVMDVRLGSVKQSLVDGATRYGVRAAFGHPQYTEQGFDFDIGLLKLKRDVTFTAYIRPVALPTDISASFAGDNAVFTGFGAKDRQDTLPKTMRELKVVVLSNEDCREKHGDDIGAMYICAGPNTGLEAGTCVGDSGGGLVTRVGGKHVIIGTASFSHKPCGQPGIPTVCARVNHQDIFRFIQRTIAFE